MLSIENLNAGYKGEKVLHDINLKVPQGSVIALIGPNGSGKTTLIRAISGILTPASGKVRYNDQDLTQKSIQDRSKLVAVVPQIRNLPPAFSVYEVVALGRTPYLNWFGITSGQDHEIVKQSMAQVDLLEMADRNIAELSGGEQQRVMLARALAQQTPVLIMDEPTSHLDLQYQVSFLKSVHRLAHPSQAEIQNGFEPRSALVAIHDLNLLTNFADQVALMVDGRLVKLGTPAEVLQPEILSGVYHLPLTTLQDPITGHFAVLPR
jgi:iron complex transport system ATP-binding protein